MIYVLGINSFLGKNFYLLLKRKNILVTCISHGDIGNLDMANDDDMIINFCGVNRANSKEEYNDGNLVFVSKIVDLLAKTNKYPLLIHISSTMIYGFEGKNIEDLPQYQQFFINSKKEAENYLLANYPQDKLLIVRPSNIYGYNCEPYYNNLLVSLVYDKITGMNKINNINKNCKRNFLSVKNFCDSLCELIVGKKTGTINLISSNNINLYELLKIIYNIDIPSEINILDGELNIPAFDKNDNSVIINENLIEEISILEDNMTKYVELNKQIEIKILERLKQQRGDMIEISELNAERLYMITLKDNAVRGNHYHYKQIEHFYVNCGKIIFLLAHKDYPNIIKMQIISNDMLVIVNPLIIHTLVNDFIKNTNEVFVLSTQMFISNSAPDTEYINILNI